MSEVRHDGYDWLGPHEDPRPDPNIALQHRVTKLERMLSEAQAEVARLTDDYRILQHTVKAKDDEIAHLKASLEECAKTSVEERAAYTAEITRFKEKHDAALQLIKMRTNDLGSVIAERETLQAEVARLKGEHLVLDN